MKSITIKSDQSKTYCKSLIDQAPSDGSITVEVKKTPSSATYKQQKLWFKWCGEVARSGLGQDDITNDVHIRMKWKIVRPILLEENEVFGIIYDAFMETVEGSVLKREYCREFADKYIHTNDLSRKGRIRSLDEFFRYWCLQHGVNLSDPNLQGVDLNKWKHLPNRSRL